MTDWAHIRSEFPALSLQRDHKPLVFLDSGASAQKPQQVIDRMAETIECGYANVHRGQYYLSETATSDYEAARATIATFLNAESADNIVFGMNATATINLVALGYAAKHFGVGDTVLFSALEHHANIVPWQMAAKIAGFNVKIIPLNDHQEIDTTVYAEMLEKHRVKMVAIAHSSNVLGSITPIKEYAALAHQAGAKILIDGCQGVVHLPVDVQATDIDFYCASGHKLYGPSGIGFIYGKAALLQETQPIMGGGDMIKTVAYDHSVYAEPPARFEPGTPPIIEAIGLATALDYMQQIGIENIQQREEELSEYLLNTLSDIPQVKVWGRARDRAGVAAFTVTGAHPQDVGQMLDRLSGVAVRAGNHCAMPLHDYLKIPHQASVRASLGLYNNHADIDALADGLRRVIKLVA